MMNNMNGIPDHLRGGLQRYIKDRIQPGAFLLAALSNDFAGATVRACDDTKPHLRGIAIWLLNEAPSDCWGSPQTVKNWLSGGE